MNKTSIEWTDATWNPIRGCSRVSEGCRNCYAEKVAYRFSGPGQPYEGLATKVNGHAAWTGKIELAEKRLLDPMKWKSPRRIFVNSMSDLFHENVPDEWIDKIFAVMALCPQHTFQILTKRPERMLKYVLDCARPYGRQSELRDLIRAIGRSRAEVEILAAQCRISGAIPTDTWKPLPNVWLGVSVENQPTADERIPLLLRTPAAVRFISGEPLLGLMRLANTNESTGKWDDWIDPLESHSARQRTIDWVICGGESGPDARPMHPDWARALRDQCQTASVPFFFKQWGEWKPTEDPAVAKARGIPLADCMSYVGKKAADALLDGREWREFPEAK